MGEIVQGPIGPEAIYKIEFVGGKLIAKVAYEGQLGGANTEIFLKSDAVIDALAAAIPGKIDDLVLAEVKLLLAAKAS